jgi:hypothetical protein
MPGCSRSKVDAMESSVISIARFIRRISSGDFTSRSSSNTPLPSTSLALGSARATAITAQ